MEEFSFHDSKIEVFVADKPKAAAIAKGKTKVSGRKTLADISNIPQQFATSSQNNRPQPSSNDVREIIERLQKENAALVKLLADRNKVIEISGSEVHKLRDTLQKVNQQNLQLAQSNNQILTELNSVKEMQKVLKHELGCKNALIIAKSLELEEKMKSKMYEANDIDNNKVVEPEVCTVAESDDDKQHNTNRNCKSKSNLATSITKIEDNDAGKTKRIQRRRQSARFKVDEPKPTEESVKIEINDSNSLASSSKKEDGFIQEYKPQECSKTSLSRPKREAAKKVQSYKEVNVNVKMRRE